MGKTEDTTKRHGFYEQLVKIKKERVIQSHLHGDMQSEPTETLDSKRQCSLHDETASAAPPSRQPDSVNNIAEFKSGYIGGQLFESIPREGPSNREPVEANTPDSPINGLKIESELHGDM